VDVVLLVDVAHMRVVVAVVVEVVAVVTRVPYNKIKWERTMTSVQEKAAHNKNEANRKRNENKTKSPQLLVGFYVYSPQQQQQQEQGKQQH